MNLPEDEIDYMSPEFLTTCIRQDLRPGLIVGHAEKRKADIDKKEKEIAESLRKHHKLIQEYQKKRIGGLKTVLATENTKVAIVPEICLKPDISLSNGERARIQCEIDSCDRSKLKEDVTERFKRRPVLKEDEDNNYRDRRYYRYKPMHEEQRDRMEEGLKTALSSSNKGFAMLQKMGYKPGTSLGKGGTSGIVEPVSVIVKTDRIGLGWQAMMADHRRKKERRRRDSRSDRERTSRHKHSRRDKERSRRKEPRRSKSKEILTAKEYRDKKQIEKEEKYLSQDLSKTKNVIYELDCIECREEPLARWFWPEDKQNTNISNSEDEDEEEFEPHEQLQILTQYVRETYFCCIWCGIAYENDEDLNENCPGDNRNIHV